MKKILLISYYFDPCPAIGSKRWSEFFTLFNEDQDFDITVLTANWEGHSSEKDNIIYIGESIQFKPFKSINREFTLLDNLKHPSLYFRSLDRHMFNDPWYEHAKNWIHRNRNRNFDIVISSYTPINTIRLGNYAKDVFHAKLVVDMRDMMSLQGQKLKLPIIHTIDTLVDKFLMKKADIILSVGPTICKKASKFYRRNVHLIYNAFLEKDFKHKEFKLPNKNKLTFSYMGTMGVKRNPRGFIELAENFAKENNHIAIEMNFASQDDPHEFLKDLEIKNIKINWLGYLNKSEITQLKSDTDCFILLEDTNVNGKENVTGKIFEYMLEQKPVAAYCHPDSDIKDILNRSGIGRIITTDSEFKSFISFITGGSFKIEDKNILQFSREKQYQQLKKVLL